MKKKLKGFSVFDVITHIIIILLCVITIYPFLHVLAVSLSDETAILQGKIGIMPKGLNLEYYKTVLKYPMVWTGYKNTLIYVSLGVLINMVMTILGAYPLSRKEFYPRNFFSMFIAVTMFFSGGLIPTYLVVQSLGMVDTIWAMVIPGAINTFNLIIMRTFLSAVPSSLVEAAKIDGANQFQILWRVVLPCAKSGIATITLFYMVEHWNSFFPALIYLNDPKLHPMQLMLQKIVIEKKSINMQMDSSPGYSDGIKYAIIMITIIPIIMVYPFVQKYFTKGAMIGAIKE